GRPTLGVNPGSTDVGNRISDQGAERQADPHLLECPSHHGLSFPPSDPPVGWPVFARPDAIRHLARFRFTPRTRWFDMSKSILLKIGAESGGTITTAHRQVKAKCRYSPLRGESARLGAGVERRWRTREELACGAWFVYIDLMD